MCPVTPAQDKFIIDNIPTARKAARKYSRGQYADDRDELASVALLALCEYTSARPESLSGRDVYWHCVSRVWTFVKSRANGRVCKSGPKILSLEGYAAAHNLSEDKVIYDQLLAYGMDNTSGDIVERERKHCRKGHELTPRNSQVTATHVKCRRCNAQAQANRRKLAKTQN